MLEKNSLQNEIYNFHFVIAVSFCYNVFDCCLIKIFLCISQCVEAFIRDFKTEPKYKGAYVYFTDCK